MAGTLTDDVNGPQWALVHCAAAVPGSIVYWLAVDFCVVDS